MPGDLWKNQFSAHYRSTTQTYIQQVMYTTLTYSGPNYAGPRVHNHGISTFLRSSAPKGGATVGRVFPTRWAQRE